jgi:hypothetical protein
MKKLSEFRDDEAMDVLCEILDPAINLISDKEFRLAVWGSKEKEIAPDRKKGIKIAMKDHRSDVVKILAVLNETPVEEFHYNVASLTLMMLELFNDKELIAFFAQQGRRTSQTPSGSATENTEESQDISSSM